MRESETHCRHGHELAVVGVYERPNGVRDCLACKRAAKARENARHAEARRSQPPRRSGPRGPYKPRVRVEAKRCARCRLEKAAHAFRPNQHSADFLGSWCMDCSREAVALHIYGDQPAAFQLTITNTGVVADVVALAARPTGPCRATCRSRFAWLHSRHGESLLLFLGGRD